MRGTARIARFTAYISAVSERPSFPAFEEQIVEHWETHRCFERSQEIAEEEQRPIFSFFDGPPFATGLPHYGHILAGTIKDVVTRYAYQTGHSVPRRFGWDCHGLPVEHIVDKKFKVEKRSDIEEKIGIATYNEECRSIVMMYCGEWRKIIQRCGRWIDFDNDYKSMDITFMESVWWVFGQMFKKGLVYRDFKVMPFSTACGTPLANFEASQNYKEVSDPSVVLAFPLTQTRTVPTSAGTFDLDNVEVLAWTTTPWTLPSNLFLTVHPDFEYTVFEHNSRRFLAAQCRLAPLFKDMKVPNFAKAAAGTDTTHVKILASGIRGKDLAELKYKPMFDFFSRDEYWAERAWKIAVDDYVTSDTGTGIVQCAPAFGEDDYRVGVASGVLEVGGRAVPCPVDDAGCLCAPVDMEGLAGVYVKDADKVCKQYFKDQGRLIVNDTAVHSYPHCWRSDTPLIYKAVPSWFIKVTAIKDRLLDSNTRTRWVPKAIQEGRFHNWLADARDWCVSRNRYWGTPIPLWVSEDFNEVVCISSIEELQKYTDKPISDLHRHHIDDIVIPDPRGSEYPPLRRVPEVFDCWFESGSMPYAQKHYPFENKESFEQSFPCDFVGEGLDQTRGWFYTLSVIGTALFDTAPFKNLIVNGLVLASDGKKMSKRLNNYPEPSIILNEHGADALRLFLISSPAVRAESVRFRDEQVKEVVKSILLPWYHAFRFLLQEVTRSEMVSGQKWQLGDIKDESQLNDMDLWILSLTNTLVSYVHTEMQNFRLYTSCSKLLGFLDQLTNWYVRLNRDRMRGTAQASLSLSVLYEVLMKITTLMAPFTPFLSETIYQTLKQALPESNPRRQDSIHYLMLPTSDESAIHKEREVSVGALQSVIVLVRQLRERRKTTMKTPIKKLTVIGGDEKIIAGLKELSHYIADEVNVLEVECKYEQDCIQLKALPNLPVLGAKYGKDLKALGPAIRNLTHAELKQLVEADTLSVCGRDISTGDILLQRSPQGISEDENLAVECNDDYLVVADMEMTADLMEIALCREISTRIQKLRKESNLKLDDEVLSCVFTDDQSTMNAISSRKSTIEQMLRRPIQTSDVVETESKKLIASQEYEIHESTVTVKFYAM